MPRRGLYFNPKEIFMPSSPKPSRTMIKANLKRMREQERAKKRDASDVMKGVKKRNKNKDKDKKVRDMKSRMALVASIRG